MTYTINVVVRDNGTDGPDLVITTEPGENPWDVANQAVRELENEMLERFPQRPAADIITDAFAALRRNRHSVTFLPIESYGPLTEISRATTPYPSSDA